MKNLIYYIRMDYQPPYQASGLNGDRIRRFPPYETPSSLPGPPGPGRWSPESGVEACRQREAVTMVKIAVVGVGYWGTNHLRIYKQMLDAGELELLIDDPQRAAELIRSFQTQMDCPEEKRKCPICLKKMDKVIVGKNEPQLLIDRCRRNHGLWFDAGELQDILNRAKLDEDSKIQHLLADMFGTKRDG